MVLSVNMEEINREDENTENLGLGCAMEMFSEIEEVIKMIDNLKSIYSSSVDAEREYERFIKILDRYQEQSHLIDPKLESMLVSLITIVRCPDSPDELIHETFKYLYIIMKVRGFKVVVRHFPHEVSDFEPVLKLLERQDPENKKTWQTRYVLILWLSIIVLIPFHMSRLDAFQPGEDSKGQKTVMERLLAVCRLYALTDLSSAAAFLASRFLTRSDVKEVHLTPFLDWACEVIVDPSSTATMQCGSLSALACVLKHGKREDLLPFAPGLLKWLVSSQYRTSQNGLVRKLATKVVQRIGLMFLKPRIAVWRYQRGSRSLAANLSAGGDLGAHQGLPTPAPECQLEENFDVPEQMEDVIAELILSLKDASTNTRWSAAKGVGRVTGRLPQDLADDVLEGLLELFSPRESDAAWHGGCLALAELGRRGLLLPHRLGGVVPLIIRALTYDEPRGYASVGTHIRDAACYVCWAFARAYDTDTLMPFVQQLAPALLVVAVFDREVNCRRAASAAFQENVGRQGAFPHGIDILTAADYFTVGVRTNAFLSISMHIAQYEEYTQPLLEHLLERKVPHWDTAIRELSAKALHNLTPLAVDFMAGPGLSRLLSQTNSVDLNCRHGAIMAVGEVLHALAKVATNTGTSLEQLVGAGRLEEVRSLVPHLRKRLQFRGVGGELMKQACCYLVEKCSLAAVPVEPETLSDWQALLDECLIHDVAVIRSMSCHALPAFLDRYCQPRNPDGSENAANLLRRDELVSRYAGHLSASNQTVRMGYAQALGCMPVLMLDGQLQVVVPALVQCAKITEPTLKWAESRRDAIRALSNTCSTVGLKGDGSCGPHLNTLFDCFLEGLKEYTLESRGDIGAWVREAAMTALQVLTLRSAKETPAVLTEELMTRIMSGVAGLAVERIDRTRGHAGKVFSALLHSDPEVPNILHRAALLRIFPPEECRSGINWTQETHTFPRFIQLLSLAPYTPPVMLGVALSVGGLTESLVKHSSQCLFSYLKTLHANLAELSRLCDLVADLLSCHVGVDRVVVPLLTFLERLLVSNCVRSVVEDPASGFPVSVLASVKRVVGRCKEAVKLIACVNLLCQLVQVPGSVSTRSLSQLSILLCHRFLFVRRAVSGRLYESLMLFGEDSSVPPDNLEAVMTLLCDTDWEQEVAIIRPVRNTLCELMAVPPPRSLAQPPTSQ